MIVDKPLVVLMYINNRINRWVPIICIIADNKFIKKIKLKEQDMGTSSFFYRKNEKWERTIFNRNCPNTEIYTKINHIFDTLQYHKIFIEYDTYSRRYILTSIYYLRRSSFASVFFLICLCSNMVNYFFLQMTLCYL